VARGGFNRKLLLGGILALGLAGSTSVCAAPAGDPTGWWLDQTQRAGILIQHCGTGFCGRIAWLRFPRNAAGKLKTDIHNSDPAQRARMLCGAAMIGGFQPDGPGKWDSGWIYNPDDGDTYRSTLRLEEDGTLRVRGYVGIPLFGKSEIWTRPTAPLTPCATP
jgi:uncharacterized protein (DUF2147 family)